ncbi:MAG: hypothetical protein GXY23_03460 [Myxococcales bacterium]|nr:hypothetical protein [Myxococcales bacterium]
MSSSSTKLWTMLRVCLFAFALVAFAPAAEAQDRQPKVIELEDIVIESEVQKPTAFYILNRSNLGYEVMDLRTSFLDEIVRSAQREPF